MPKYVSLANTQSGSLYLVRRVYEQAPDPLQPFHDLCPDDAVESGWYRDNGSYRPGTFADQTVGWTNPQRRDYAKQYLDAFYWYRVAKAENPFNPGYAIYNPTGNKVPSECTFAINQVKAARREYIDSGGSDAEVDAVLAEIIPYYQAMQTAYPLAWSAIKNGNIDLYEIEEQAWPDIPAFVGSPAADSPGGIGGFPPPEL